MEVLYRSHLGKGTEIAREIVRQDGVIWLERKSIRGHGKWHSFSLPIAVWESMRHGWRKTKIKPTP